MYSFLYMNLDLFLEDRHDLLNDKNKFQNSVFIVNQYQLKKKVFTVRLDWIVMVSGRTVSMESEIP